MMEPFPAGLTNPADWQEVFNQGLVSTDWNVPIQTGTVAVRSGAIAALVANLAAPPRWFLGGWLTVSASTAFGPAVFTRVRLELNRVALVRLPPTLEPLQVEVNCPRWLQRATIIINEFTGPDDRLIQKITRIEDYVD